MSRRTLTFASLFTGLALVVISYFFLTAPWGADRVGNADPRMEWAALLTVLGVILAFLSAVIYELLPDRDETEDG